MIMKLLSGIFLLLSTLSVAQTPRINFKAPKFYPEGVAWDRDANRFLIGSVKTGTIGSVTENGDFAPLYVDSTLKSSFGMKIDGSGKLWVCTGDPTYSIYKDSSTYKKMIRLIGIDLKTGKKTDDIDLSSLFPGKHFANDLVLDNAGNKYITDSYSPVVYRVDAGGKATVFAQSPLLGSIDVGLNGIVWSNKGFLIVANSSQGQLYKIDINNPTSISVIHQTTFFPGADGLLWDTKGNLLLAQNRGVHKIFQLTSKDNWGSCEVIASTLATDRFIQPSTIASTASSVYVLNSKLNELSDLTAKPSEEFSLQKVILHPVK